VHCRYDSKFGMEVVSTTICQEVSSGTRMGVGLINIVWLP